MLHRRAVELGGDLREHRLALGARFVVHAHLDELVRQERDVDLVQHGRGQALLADGHHGLEVMRPRAKRAPLGRFECRHAASLARRLRVMSAA